MAALAEIVAYQGNDGILCASCVRNRVGERGLYIAQARLIGRWYDPLTHEQILRMKHYYCDRCLKEL